MKHLSQIALNSLPVPSTEKLIHAIQDVFILRMLESPICSSEARCPVCGGNDGHDAYINSIGYERMWFCSNLHCLALFRRSNKNPSKTIAESKRSIEWPKFCEINGIGDIHGDVKFEKLEQSKQKIDYLLSFCKKPHSIIVMQGPPGTGKTYAAMGVCELFTRKNPSCFFFTQDELCSQWLDAMKGDRMTVFRQKISICNVLVIDDFATKEPPPGFLQFFMDIINTRLQWTDRGTIITTNLDAKNLSKFCGDSLMDRLNTGQLFTFEGKSKRTKTAI